MFFAMHSDAGPDGTEPVDAFLFFLAEKLGCGVWQLDDMPAVELVRWRSYYTVKHQQEQFAARKVGP